MALNVLTEWCQQITAQEYLFSEFALTKLTIGPCTSPIDISPFTYHPFNNPGMCTVANFQCLRIVIGQSPDKFTGKPKLVSHPNNSQEILKQK